MIARYVEQKEKVCQQCLPSANSISAKMGCKNVQYIYTEKESTYVAFTS